VSDQPDQSPPTLLESAQFVRAHVHYLMVTHENYCRSVRDMVEGPACTLELLRVALEGVAQQLAFVEQPLQIINNLSQRPLAEAGFLMMLGKMHPYQPPSTGETDHG
jgi:hypothetical protein